MYYNSNFYNLLFNFTGYNEIAKPKLNNQQILQSKSQSDYLIVSNDH